MKSRVELLRVELLIGPIASGKSTYARQKAQDGYIIINDDAIVNMLHGDFYALYNKTLKPLYKAIENIALHTAITLGKSVVIDRPNYSKAMRRRYIAIANSLDTPVYGITFADVGAKTHARRRFESDGRGWSVEDWEKIYHTHKSLYETPEINEGFVKILSAG